MSERVVSLVEQLVTKVLTPPDADPADTSPGAAPSQRQRQRMTKYAMRVLGSRIMPSVQSDEFHVSAAIKRQLQLAQVRLCGMQKDRIGVVSREHASEENSTTPESITTFVLVRTRRRLCALLAL